MTGELALSRHLLFGQGVLTFLYACQILPARVVIGNVRD